jgi:hypothetical protein
LLRISSENNHLLYTHDKTLLKIASKMKLVFHPTAS